MMTMVTAQWATARRDTMATMMAMGDNNNDNGDGMTGNNNDDDGNDNDYGNEQQR